MTSFAHTRSTFENGLLNMKYAEFTASIHWRNVRINIANSSGEIDILIFNNAIRGYRKYFRKVVET